MLDLLLVALGVLLALSFVGGLVYLYVQDVTQEKHAVLRNFPLVGHLRYFFERLGEYFRQYFFLGDRADPGAPGDRSGRTVDASPQQTQGFGLGSPQSTGPTTSPTWSSHLITAEGVGEP